MHEKNWLQSIFTWKMSTQYHYDNMQVWQRSNVDQAHSINMFQMKGRMKSNARLIVKSSFNINLLTQLKYLISIFWFNSNTRFQHSDSTWYRSRIDTRFEFSTQLVKKSKMTSRELNIEIFPVFRLCITFLHYLFGRKP